MKKESQNIEYKESWKDEYLKWICGFANANGGKLYIGIDDNGKIVGVDNANELLEEIPNKISDTMTIICEVNLITKSNRDIIEIVVDSYDNTIAFNSYAIVSQYPASPYDCDTNTFYIDYNIDKFNDFQYDDPYIINRRYGTFSNELLNVYNQKCVFYISTKTHTNSTMHYFGIGMSLYGNTDVLNEYDHSISIKFDDQTYDYPYPVRMGKSGWLIISEAETPELYQVLFLLLAQGKTFKMRLDELSSVATYYVVEVTPTNFAEAYTYCYSQENN